MVRRMLFGLCVSALALGAISSMSAAPNDAAVQKLDDITSLVRLKTETGGVHAYVQQVAKAYQRAGYGKFARELKKSEALFETLADSDTADTTNSLPAARWALRHLAITLEKSNFIVVPAEVGRRMPNYFLIAAGFVVNSNKALRNLTLGKPVTRGLTIVPDTAWVTNLGGETVELAGSTGGVIITNGANTYSGSTTITGGTLTMGSSNFTLTVGGTTDIITGTGAVSIANFGLVTTGVGTLSIGGVSTYDGLTTVSSGWLIDNTTSGTAFSQALLCGGSLSISNFSSSLLAVPANVPVPADITDAAFLKLTQPYTVNGIDFAAGTQFFKVGDDYVAPDGTTLLPAGPLTAAPSATPTPTPSPTP